MQACRGAQLLLGTSFPAAAEGRKLLQLLILLRRPAGLSDFARSLDM